MLNKEEKRINKMKNVKWLFQVLNLVMCLVSSFVFQEFMFIVIMVVNFIAIEVCEKLEVE